jgi:hypothetical protein
MSAEKLARYLQLFFWSRRPIQRFAGLKVGGNCCASGIAFGG